MMSAELAANLYRAGKIDFILCFAPSREVAAGLASTFERQVGQRFDGQIGAIGGAYTYQSMAYLDSVFWEMLDRYRVFVVFDEIHHCAGSNLNSANSWGEEILRHIQDRAAYTLALTGTPWRSDKRPIVLSRYGINGIECDYVYGLRDAVLDGVCRKPNIVLIDNDKLAIEEEGKHQEFAGISALLTGSKRAYRSILHNETALRHCLEIGVEKLNHLRRSNSAAAGLVVASSVSHARKVLQILKEQLGQSASLVTYRENNARQVISHFRLGDQPWIVSVGMISEGTDIPRIQVCCHLSSITTELYFRQILGRGIRITPECDGDTWLYTFAEPKIVEYANRIAEDLPEHQIVFQETEHTSDITTPERPCSPKSSAENPSTYDGTSSLMSEEWSVHVSEPSAVDKPRSMEFLGAFTQKLCGLVLPT
ncbi:Helicase conserved C-terminal domain-containing protein [Ferrimonas sediminum]|uniref:Helicase conserved C-terminal domain-containing protein n=2 Tax=Ferrimonas sediminum TaxID=718193 RepID=A0A1G8U086_9GAMM|nr:Helicase conserved C-terminal domain-containing protein [Ferrimonas sediminum]